jgi:hypothetical protein
MSKKTTKRKELRISVRFECNRLEEESLIAAYELVLPVSEKSVRPRKEKQLKSQVHQEQMRLAVGT